VTFSLEEGWPYKGLTTVVVWFSIRSFIVVIYYKYAMLSVVVFVFLKHSAIFLCSDFFHCLNKFLSCC
jgi:hypothetical protein